MSLPGYDAWATGGRYNHYPADLECSACGWQGSGEYHEEYGAGWTDPEECPECGGELAAEPMSDYDIAERKAEARGDI